MAGKAYSFLTNAFVCMAFTMSKHFFYASLRFFYVLIYLFTMKPTVFVTHEGLKAVMLMLDVVAKFVQAFEDIGQYKTNESAYDAKNGSRHLKNL